MPLELLAFLLLVLVLAVWLIVRHQNLRLRQMQHRERLAAIDRAVDDRSSEGPTTFREGDQEMSDPMTQWKDPSTYINWFRITTLGLAFLLMFGGVGLLTAFIIMPDPEMQRIWSVGLIPMMAGFGLFLFAILSSKLIPKKEN